MGGGIGEVGMDGDGTVARSGLDRATEVASGAG